MEEYRKSNKVRFENLLGCSLSKINASRLNCVNKNIPYEEEYLQLKGTDPFLLDLKFCTMKKRKVFSLTADKGREIIQYGKEEDAESFDKCVFMIIRQWSEKYEKEHLQGYLYKQGTTGLINECKKDDLTNPKECTNHKRNKNNRRVQNSYVIIGIHSHIQSCCSYKEIKCKIENYDVSKDGYFVQIHVNRNHKKLFLLSNHECVLINFDEITDGYVIAHYILQNRIIGSFPRRRIIKGEWFNKSDNTIAILTYEQVRINTRSISSTASYRSILRLINTDHELSEEIKIVIPEYKTLQKNIGKKIEEQCKEKNKKRTKMKIKKEESNESLVKEEQENLEKPEMNNQYNINKNDEMKFLESPVKPGSNDVNSTEENHIYIRKHNEEKSINRIETDYNRKECSYAKTENNSWTEKREDHASHSYFYDCITNEDVYEYYKQRKEKGKVFRKHMMYDDCPNLVIDFMFGNIHENYIWIETCIFLLLKNGLILIYTPIIIKKCYISYNLLLAINEIKEKKYDKQEYSEDFLKCYNYFEQVSISNFTNTYVSAKFKKIRRKKFSYVPYVIDALKESSYSSFNLIYSNNFVFFCVSDEFGMLHFLLLNYYITPSMIKKHKKVQTKYKRYKQKHSCFNIFHNERSINLNFVNSLTFLHLLHREHYNRYLQKLKNRIDLSKLIQHIREEKDIFIKKHSNFNEENAKKQPIDLCKEGSVSTWNNTHTHDQMIYDETVEFHKEESFVSCCESYEELLSKLLDETEQNECNLLHVTVFDTFNTGIKNAKTIVLPNGNLLCFNNNRVIELSIIWLRFFPVIVYFLYIKNFILAKLIYDFCIHQLYMHLTIYKSKIPFYEFDYEKYIFLDYTKDLNLTTFSALFDKSENLLNYKKDNSFIVYQSHVLYQIEYMLPPILMEDDQSILSGCSDTLFFMFTHYINVDYQRKGQLFLTNNIDYLTCPIDKNLFIIYDYFTLSISDQFQYIKESQSKSEIRVINNKKENPWCALSSDIKLRNFEIHINTVIHRNLDIDLHKNRLFSYLKYRYQEYMGASLEKHQIRPNNKCLHIQDFMQTKDMHTFANGEMDVFREKKVYLPKEQMKRGEHNFEKNEVDYREYEISEKSLKVVNPKIKSKENELNVDPMGTLPQGASFDLCEIQEYETNEDVTSMFEYECNYDKEDTSNSSSNGSSYSETDDIDGSSMNSETDTINTVDYPSMNILKKAFRIIEQPIKSIITNRVMDECSGVLDKREIRINNSIFKNKGALEDYESTAGEVIKFLKEHLIINEIKEENDTQCKDLIRKLYKIKNDYMDVNNYYLKSHRIDMNVPLNKEDHLKYVEKLLEDYYFFLRLNAHYEKKFTKSAVKAIHSVAYKMMNMIAMSRDIYKTNEKIFERNAFMKKDIYTCCENQKLIVEKINTLLKRKNKILLPNGINDAKNPLIPINEIQNNSIDNTLQL